MSKRKKKKNTDARMSLAAMAAHAGMTLPGGRKTEEKELTPEEIEESKALSTKKMEKAEQKRLRRAERNRRIQQK